MMTLIDTECTVVVTLFFPTHDSTSLIPIYVHTLQIESARVTSRTLFELPVHVKRQYARVSNDDPFGYSEVGVERSV